MEAMTVQELLEATGGKLLAGSTDQTITAVETDSRAIHPGALFVALRGEQTDGHKFVAGALQSGAEGCLVIDPPVSIQPGKFCVQVPSQPLPPCMKR